MRSQGDVERILEMLTMRGVNSENTYMAFHPLIRLRGTLTKMHITKLTKYPRLLYLNPIGGVLTFYKTVSKFPHQHHFVIHLDTITTLEFMRETKWYFSRGCYYIKIATKDKTVVFFDDNLDVINFWVNQISVARKFYSWLQDLIKIRYKVKQGDCINNCIVANCKCSIDATEHLINTAMKLTLPEVDID